MILGWTVLRPSARERRLRLAAVAAAALTGAALLAAALLADPRHPVSVWSAAFFAVAATASAVFSLKRASVRRVEVAIRHDGTLLARKQDTPESAPQKLPRIVFVAPWLVTLRCGATLVPIWPDSVGSEAFRRLHACARWARMPDPADPGKDDRQSGTIDDAPR